MLTAALVAFLMNPVPWRMAGTTPAVAGRVERITWVPAGQLPDAVTCGLDGHGGWWCESRGADAPEGLIVLVGEACTAFVGVGSDLSGCAKHGRLLWLDEPDQIRLPYAIELLTPRRSAGRPGNRRLLMEKAPGAKIWPLTANAAWITWDNLPGDAVLQVQAADGSRRWRPAQWLSTGDVAQPEIIQVGPGVELFGRVETRTGAPVPDATVELLSRLAPARAARPEEADWARVAVSRSGPDGMFRMEGIEAGDYQVSVDHPVEGRALVETRLPAGSLTVPVVPPRRITGRVLAGQTPVNDVTVQFLPRVEAWQASADPRDHASPPVTTDAQGAFALGLPAHADGTLLLRAPAGQTLRMPIPPGSPQLLDVGDLQLAEPTQLLARILSGAPGCRLAAAGPLGGLGLTIVRSAAAGAEQVILIPEPGQWLLSAECGGQPLEVSPPAVAVTADAGTQQVNIRIHPRQR